MFELLVHTRYIGEMNVFLEKSYKSALRNALAAKKASMGEGWNLSRLAEHCSIQKTYLSRVFNGKAHLNVDQLYLALDYLDLSEDERLYIELLHHWERSDVPKRRTQLQRSLDELRRRHTRTERHLNDSSELTDVKGMEAYYLNPNAQLVHLFLTIPRYAENPPLIAAKLGISDDVLKKILGILQQVGLIAIVAKRLKVVRENLHLPTDSSWIKPYQTMIRVKAIERLQNTSEKENYGYSLFFSANDAAKHEIQSRFFAFLKDLEKIVRPAKCEKVYQLQFDLIDWT